MRLASLVLVLVIGLAANAVAQAPSPSPAPAPAPAGPGSCVVLCYHHVDDAAKMTEYHVSPADFEAQLEHLKAEGYAVLPLAKIVDAYRGKGTLPVKAVAITIDDGWRCANEKALPLLKQYGFSATLFIYPQMVGNGGDKNSYDEYKEIAKDPLVSIACHSWSHPNLLKDGEKVKGEARDAWLQKEYVESKAKLEKELGLPIRWLAYPYGLYDAQVSNIVRAAGYEAAFSVNAAPNSPRSDPMFLNRIMIMKSDGIKGFARKVASLPLAVEALSPGDGALLKPGAHTFSARVVDPDVKPETLTMIGPGKAKSAYDPATRTLTLAVGAMGSKVYQIAATGRDRETNRVRRTSWLVRVKGAQGAAAPAPKTKRPAKPKKEEEEEEAEEE